jgi:protein O-mannosyl-transferase
MSRPSTQSLVLMILLAGVCLVVFGQGTGHEFTNLDDDQYVAANPYLEQGLSPAGLRWAVTTRRCNLYMPVTWISYLADRQFFGPEPAAYHRTNILLHLLNTLLLYLILRRLTGSLWRPALVAALFAVHPLHVESVAWVAERKDVLSGFFFLLTIRLYIGYGYRPTVIRYLISLLCFMLALLSKPMVVTLPVVLILIVVWKAPRPRPMRRLLAEKIPFLFVALGLALTTYLLVQTRATGAPDPIPLGERLGQAVVFYTLYLGKMFWPTNLSVSYPPEGLHFQWAQILFSTLVLTALTVMGWLTRKQFRRPWLGWLWYLVTLLPVAGIIQGGMQLMSDRYFYLPSIGLFVAVVFLAARVAHAHPWLHRVIPVLAILAVMMAAIGSYRQTRVWQNSETLFAHALEINPDDYLSHMNLGVVLNEAGRPGEALPHLRRAVELRPNALHSFSLANTLSHLGRYDEAVPCYRDALRFEMEFPKAHNNLGIALAKTGVWDRAGEEFQLAVDQDPDYAGAHYNLGLIRMREIRMGEAAASFRRTLELAPDHHDAQAQLVLLTAAGD